MVTRKIDLQIKPGGGKHHLRFRQHETGKGALQIHLMDDGELYVLPMDVPAELCFSRADGCGFSVPCSVGADVLIADVVSDMTECLGKVVCVVLYPLNGDWICTDDFTVTIVGEEAEDANTTDTA